MALWSWLRDNHEPVSAAAGIVSVIGSIVTLTALIVTIVVASCQLDLTRRSLQNNLVYQMQKDERTASAEFFGGKTTETAPIFALMQAVFLQRKLGSVPDNVWDAFQKDFCKLFTSERFKRDWSAISKDGFSGDFVDFMEGITKVGAPECKGRKP